MGGSKPETLTTWTYKKLTEVPELSHREAFDFLIAYPSTTILEAVGKGWDYEKVEEVPEVTADYGWVGLLTADADCYLAALEGNDEHPQVN